MKFQTDDVVAGLELGSEASGAEIELVVSGTLLDGTAFTSAGDFIVIVPQQGSSTLTVTPGGPFLDIKPGSCPNPLNLNSHGVLPVALVGTGDFDVTTVDISTLRLRRTDGIGGEVAPNEGPPGPHTVIEDVATPFYGGLGERDFIDGFLEVPDNIMQVVGELLPECHPIPQAWLSGSYDANLVVSEQAHVSLTFLHEGADYRNSFGYFTYVTDGSSISITSRQLIFPNASFADPNKGWNGGQLVTGDTVTLRDEQGDIRVFEVDTRIGFFLVADGWNGSEVTGWDPGNPDLPKASASDNGPIAQGVFTTVDELNPEFGAGRPDVARHVVVVRVTGVVGFLDSNDFHVVGLEDLRRDGSSDNDFNDVVFIVQSDPVTAIDDTHVPDYDPASPDPDGDGVEGADDAFPHDPDRAVVIRTPSSGHQTVAFEDNYPKIGDADYNDVVIEYAFDEALSANGRLKDLLGTFHLIARGAGYDHRFGLTLHGIPADTTGTVAVQRFDKDGESSQDPQAPLGDFLRQNLDGSWTIRLDHLFPSTKAALSTPNGGFANTREAAPTVLPASVRFRVTFDTAVERAPLGTVPFDPFIQVVHGDELYDIHRPGKPPFLDRPSQLPTEGGPITFIDKNAYPWVMLCPYDWRYPLESVHIGGDSSKPGAYPQFHLWRGSFGFEAQDWYVYPDTTTDPPLVTDPIAEFVLVRPWNIQVGE